MSKKTLNAMKTLQEAFEKNKELTIPQMMTLLNCNRISVNNYIHRLEDTGIEFQKRCENRLTYYSVRHSSEESSYEPLTLDILRKYQIVRELQAKPVPKESFAGKFTLISGTGDENPDGTPLDVGQTKFYELIKELKEDGDIEFNAGNGTYRLTGKNIPLNITCNEDFISNLNTDLSNIPSGTPYFDELKSLYAKTNILLGSLDDQLPSLKNYLIYGKRYDGLQTLADTLKIITSCDYKHKLLKIRYHSRTEGMQTLDFAVGIMIYNVEKYQVYLIGDVYSEKTTNTSLRHRILNLKRIEAAEEEIFENPCYHDTVFLEMFQNMFSISIDKPYDVTIEFDNFGNIEQKINSLKKQRPNASIERNGKKFIYKDKVSGLDDFASYLRRFGFGVRVLEPEELRDKMRYSVIETLRLYQEETNHELS